MIRFDILQRADAVVGFRVRGHSGFAASGADIVCSAVSVLVYNAINSCERFAGISLSVQDDGDSLRCQLPKQPSEAVRLLMNSLFYGVEQVAEGYPEFVQLRSVQDERM